MLVSQFQIVEHGLHLMLGVAVAGSFCRSDAFGELHFGFAVAACFGQGLRGHEVAGGVVGVLLDEARELGESGVGFATSGVFHGKAVSGKGVGGVLSEDLVEHGDLIHRTIVT